MRAWLEQAAAAIRASEAEGPIAAADPKLLTGYSGGKLIGLLQRFARLLPADESCYLEVGVFQGMTLLSVASAVPALACFGIDNFAQFDPHGRNMGVVEARREQLGARNAMVINMDYEDALENLGTHLGPRRVGLYFVDGPHDYRSQLMCLELVRPYLAPACLLVVDDSNYPHVRQANRDFLVTHSDFRLIFEAYTSCHPLNMNEAGEKEARDGWWNGVNVLVHDPDHALAPMLPPTVRSRRLFENEHLIHSSNLAEVAPYVIDLVQPVFAGPWPKNLGRAARAALVIARERWRQLRSPRHRTANTDSAALPKARLHPGL